MNKQSKTTFTVIISMLILFFGINMVKAEKIATKLKGKILLQVEQNGEAWYLYPADETRYFMGRPDDAFSLMRSLGTGISNNDLQKIPLALELLTGIDADGDGLPDIFEDAIGTDKYKKDTDGDGYEDKSEILNGFDPAKGGEAKLAIDLDFAEKQKGKILLQVEQNGEAWYVNPTDGKRYFLGRPTDAFNVMRRLGLGISDNNLNKISAEEHNITNNKSLLVSPNNSKLWTLVNEYKLAINESINIEVLNSFFYEDFEPISEGDCDLIFPEKSFEECTQTLLVFGSGKSEINILNESEMSIYEDAKQGIIFQNTNNSKIRIYAINNNGEWKLLTISNTESDSNLLDGDNDGRYDDDENCTGHIYEFFPDKCIKTNSSENDTDGDGWWDGIEIEMGTDPNNKNDIPKI